MPSKCVNPGDCSAPFLSSKDFFYAGFASVCEESIELPLGHVLVLCMPGRYYEVHVSQSGRGFEAVPGRNFSQFCRFVSK